MPVQFLSDEQARRYGQFHALPSAEQLRRFFEFGPNERADIHRHRSDTARLGYAVQLGSVRFLGRFPDLAAVPAIVVDHIAARLGVTPSAFTSYARSRASLAHAAEIRARYRYTPFGEGLPHWRFLRWLYERVWTGADRPTVLVDLATAWLVEQQVLLPGITTLTRLIARVRDRAARRSWGMVVGQLGDGDRLRLERLLEVEPDTGLSVLERLRRPPRSPTIEGLVGALKRLGDVQQAAGPRRLRLDRITTGRVRALAADAGGAKAQRLSQRTPQRRLASLACYVERLLAEAYDDVIDVLLIVVHDLASRSERAVERDRLSTLDQLDAAALVLRQAALVVLDPDVADADVRSTIFRLTGRDELQGAAAVVGDLLGVGTDQTKQRLLARYPHVRRFLPALLRRIRFAAITPAHPVLAALDYLQSLESERGTNPAPTAVITDGWRPFVITDGGVDRRAYTLCVLDRLRLALRRRDVYVRGADRWGDPRRLLVAPETWKTVGPQVLRTLDLPPRAPSYLERLGAELDAAYFEAADAAEKDPTMWIDEDGPRDRVHVTQLDRLSLDPPIS